MKPIAYVACLNEFYRSQGFPPYRWTINEAAPLTRLRKPVDRCRVAMLSSGGVSRRDAAPFNPQARNDLRLDSIERDTPPGFFAINDDYYDHGDADRDINCIFPIQRLRELAAEGVIGEVAPRHYSGFMGRIYVRTAVVSEAAPALARSLREEGVDAFVLVPA
jgi:D-proline reductase (dithiol) PrdB